MDAERIRQVREGREHQSNRGDEDYRTEFERDYGRLIHSPAFRRLQGKSQVFGAGSGDYYRTRLSHTLEVAQIARHVARKLARSGYSQEYVDNPGLVIDPQVVEAAALAHDLGHPPFGHTGEKVLDQLLRPHGLRYEGNAQNFHLVMFLEKRTEMVAGSYVPVDGLNLTHAVLLGTNKYPGELLPNGNKPGSEAKDGKGLYSPEWTKVNPIRELWELKAGQRTLEAQVMDLCDDIAYSTHDLEDGIRSGKISPTMFANDGAQYNRLVEALASQVKATDRIWGGVSDIVAVVDRVLGDYYARWKSIYAASLQDVSRARREMTSHYVHKFTGATGVVPDGEWWRVTFQEAGAEALHLRREMAVLKMLAWHLLVQNFRVQRHERRSEFVIRMLWKVLKDEKKGRGVIPADWVERAAKRKGDWPWPRVAADYIAGCTDAYAEKLFGELYAGIKYGSIYEMD